MIDGHSVFILIVISWGVGPNPMEFKCGRVSSAGHGHHGHHAL
jgi:hypothetical protein